MENPKEKDEINLQFIQHLLQLQADAVTEKPVFFKVKLDDDSMVPNGKKEDKITIKPMKVRTIATLIPLLARIEDEDMEKITSNPEVAFNPESLEIFNKYHCLILQIVCIGIHNGKGDYPAWFKEMLEVNFTWKELHTFLNAILFRMDQQSFQNSIILSKKMSLINDKGIIAMSQNLKSHSISTPSL